MAKRRGKNEGGLRHRADGRWEARLPHHCYPDGKIKPRYFKTAAEGRSWLREAVSQHEKGLPLPSERQTVAQYLNHWLTTIAEPRVRPSTYARYCQLLKLHVVPIVGQVRLVRLQAADVQAVYAAAQRRGLAERTVGHVHRVLHLALEQAVRWELVQRNVTELTVPPRPKDKEINPLNKNDAVRLLAAAQDDPWEALYRMAVMTGMREGELLGLKRSDLDIDQAKPSLQVRRSLSLVKGKGFLEEEPKTKSSRRRIDLDSETVECLRRHLARQAEVRLRLGAAWQDHDLVFPNSVGGYMDAKNLVARSFRTVLAKAGLRQIRFHDLRHTCATLMLLNNAPVKVVSERLGHANIAITLQIYAHVLPTMQREAVESYATLLNVPA